MNVLSLFDGLSGCRIALERIGVTPTKYYASEIDKYAIQVAQHNYPDTEQLGSVTEWESWGLDWASIDLVTGGFPCQTWSVAGKQMGDKDERGMLFWTMLDVMKMVLKHNPKAKFLIENVKMKKEFEEYITFHTQEALGHVNKILINSALVSAQNRNRWYWHNIEGVEQPEDKGLVLADVIESGFATDEMSSKNNKSHCVTARYSGAVAWNSIEKRQRSMFLDKPSKIQDIDKNRRQLVFEKPCKISDIGKGGTGNRIYSTDGKSPTLLAQSGGKTGNGSCLIERPCEPREYSEDSLLHHAATATDIKGNESIKRVYAESGKSPTLTTMSGGHREPKVLCGAIRGRYIVGGKRQDHKILTAGLTKQRLEIRKDCKTNALTTVQKDNVVVNPELTYRKLTPLECERLQTLDDNYTLVLDENGKQLVSNSQRYKMIGNGWTIDVIAHIFKNLHLNVVTLEKGLLIPSVNQTQTKKPPFSQTENQAKQEKIISEKEII
jgi:DNA-cytosine methyltransferase